MIRRKRRTRRTMFVRFIAVGALSLWIGMLLIGILNYEPPSDTTPTAKVATSKTENESTTAGSHSPSQSPERQNRNADLGSDSASRRVGTGNNASGSNDMPGSAERQHPPAARAAGASRTENANHRAKTRTHVARDRARAQATADTSPDRVIRAQFTTGIAEQEPINRIRSVFSMDGGVFSLDGRPISTLYYFTEITGMRGETVTHRWEHDGEVVAEQSFDVGGDPWRVYSHEDLPPSTAGDWRVVVTDAQDNVIKTDSFLYQAF